LSTASPSEKKLFAATLEAAAYYEKAASEGVSWRLSHLRSVGGQKLRQKEFMGNNFVKFSNKFHYISIYQFQKKN